MNWTVFRLSVRTPNVYVNPTREQYVRNPIQQKIQQFKRFVENYRRHIVCFIVVYGIAAGLCLERCYCQYKTLLIVCICCNSEVSPPRLIKNVIFRLRFSGRIYRPTWDIGGGHRHLPRLCCRHLLPVSLPAPHCVPQSHHAVQRDVPQPIHPLRRCDWFPPLHGHDCHPPFRLAEPKVKVSRKDDGMSFYILTCVSSLLFLF